MCFKKGCLRNKITPFSKTVVHKIPLKKKKKRILKFSSRIFFILIFFLIVNTLWSLSFIEKLCLF